MDNPYSLDKFEPKDFQSNISQFSLLKTLFLYTNVSKSINNWISKYIVNLIIRFWIGVLAHHQYEDAGRWALE